MEKTILIDGRAVPFKATASFLLRYKNQFGRDALDEINRMQAAVDEGNVDIEALYNMAWVLAKTADPTIPAPLDWLDTFETFPIYEVFPQINSLIVESFRPSEDAKKN